MAGADEMLPSVAANPQRLQEPATDKDIHVWMRGQIVLYRGPLLGAVSPVGVARRHDQRRSGRFEFLAVVFAIESLSVLRQIECLHDGFSAVASWTRRSAPAVKHVPPHDRMK